MSHARRNTVVVDLAAHSVNRQPSGKEFSMKSDIERQYPPSTPRHLDEQAAMLKISRDGALATDIMRGLQSLSAAALALSGIRSVQVDPVEELAQYAGTPLVWTAPGAEPGANGCAVADITAGGIRWGELRLSFDIHALQLESPVRFAKFFAQQIAGMLNRLALQSQNRILRQRLNQQHHRLQTRKLVQRASSILARMHGIPQPDALQLLVRHSREKRSSLYRVSEGIVLLEYRLSLTHPVLRSGLITVPAIARQPLSALNLEGSFLEEPIS
jgi:hypothetical protein